MDRLRTTPFPPCEAGKVWTHEADASEPGAEPETQTTCCVGTDVPEVGEVVHSAGCRHEGLPRRSGQERSPCEALDILKGLAGGGVVDEGVGLPDPLHAFVEAMGPDDLVVRLTPDDVLEMRAFDRADSERDRLLAQLLFASRDMAESRVMRGGYPHGADLVVPVWCMECQGNEIDGKIGHAADCRTGRVLAVLAELVEASAAKASASVTKSEGGLGVSEDRGRRFEIKEGPGGSWTVKLYEDGEEAGGGQFPSDDYDEAAEFAQDWCGASYDCENEEAGPSASVGGAL